VADVTDPDGVTWSVRRWWWNTTPWETGFATIDIKRDGTKVGSEQVRGWKWSGQRVEELARAAQEGALTQLATEA
jgi:hypothetical protein